MSTKGWGWTAVAVVAVLAMLALLVARGEGRWSRFAPGPAAAEPVVATEPVAAPPRAGDGAGAAPTPGPLPPMDTPLRLSIGELQRRARAGEPVAMCRLAAELTRCKQTRAQIERVGRMLDMEAEGRFERPDAEDPERRDRRQARIVRQAEALLDESRHCDGVPDVGDRELARQWRAAAHAGSHTAIAYYASGAAFPRDQLLSLLPELERYREEAGPMAQRLAESGNFGGLLMVGMAHHPEAPRTSLLAQAVEPDPAEAMAYLRVAQELAGPSAGNAAITRMLAGRLERLEVRLTPAERERAERRAAQLRAATAGQPPPTIERRGGGDGNLVASCEAGLAGG